MRSTSWAPGTKLINLVIHDTRQGIGIWQEALDSEAYGNLIYYNGFQASDRGHGHGIYVQNDEGNKTDQRQHNLQSVRRGYSCLRCVPGPRAEYYRRWQHRVQQRSNLTQLAARG